MQRAPASDEHKKRWGDMEEEEEEQEQEAGDEAQKLLAIIRERNTWRLIELVERSGEAEAAIKQVLRTLLEARLICTSKRSGEVMVWAREEQQPEKAEDGWSSAQKFNKRRHRHTTRRREHHRRDHHRRDHHRRDHHRRDHHGGRPSRRGRRHGGKGGLPRLSADEANKKRKNRELFAERQRRIVKIFSDNPTQTFSTSEVGTKLEEMEGIKQGSITNSARYLYALVCTVEDMEVIQRAAGGGWCAVGSPAQE